MLGRALAARPRDSYVLATKMRARAPDGGRGVSRAQVLHQIDQSLEHLGAEFVGASRPEQLRENATASGVDLDDETVRAIEEAFAT